MKNTINKIILFAAFFAAGFTTSANAQVTTPASARVFYDVGMQSLGLIQTVGANIWTCI